MRFEKKNLKYLSHLASVEEIFHHEQVQFLLRVVLRVLVANPVNTQDLCQCSRSLWCKKKKIMCLLPHCDLQKDKPQAETHLLLHGSGDVGEVVRCEVQERLNLQPRHLLQDEPVVWRDTDVLSGLHCTLTT